MLIAKTNHDTIRANMSYARIAAGESAELDGNINVKGAQLIERRSLFVRKSRWLTARASAYSATAPEEAVTKRRTRTAMREPRYVIGRCTTNDAKISLRRWRSRIGGVSAKEALAEFTRAAFAGSGARVNQGCFADTRVCAALSFERTGGDEADEG